jgi:hypothetical protein
MTNWLEQRREERRIKRERSGDTNQKLAEEARAERAPKAAATVEDNAQRASAALVANSAPFAG